MYSKKRNPLTNSFQNLELNGDPRNMFKMVTMVANQGCVWITFLCSSSSSMLLESSQFEESCRFGWRSEGRGRRDVALAEEEEGERARGASPFLGGGNMMTWHDNFCSRAA
jgi:hypothetical protein